MFNGSCFAKKSENLQALGGPPFSPVNFWQLGPLAGFNSKCSTFLVTAFCAETSFYHTAVFDGETEIFLSPVAWYPYYTFERSDQRCL